MPDACVCGEESLCVALEEYACAVLIGAPAHLCHRYHRCPRDSVYKEGGK